MELISSRDREFEEMFSKYSTGSVNYLPNKIQNEYTSFLINRFRVHVYEIKKAK
jgi:hypothetical protein